MSSLLRVGWDEAQLLAVQLAAMLSYPFRTLQLGLVCVDLAVAGLDPPIRDGRSTTPSATGRRHYFFPDTCGAGADARGADTVTVVLSVQSGSDSHAKCQPRQNETIIRKRTNDVCFTLSWYGRFVQVSTGLDQYCRRTYVPGMEALVFRCAVEILGGRILQADDVTAGRGFVIDWTTVRSGETLMEDGDAYDVAFLFVQLVGPRAEAALESA